MKRRAERFGLPTKTANGTAKKEKPAAGKSAVASKPSPVLDPAEEDKKRKRAERFGKPAEPVSLSMGLEGSSLVSLTMCYCRSRRPRCNW